MKSEGIRQFGKSKSLAKHLIFQTVFYYIYIYAHTGIYSVPCKDCTKHYIGETQCNLKKESTNTNDQSKQMTIETPFSPTC